LDVRRFHTVTVIEASIHRIEQKLAGIERRLGDLSQHLRSAFT
jgi:hypothetical protein